MHLNLYAAAAIALLLLVTSSTWAAEPANPVPAGPDADALNRRDLSEYCQARSSFANTRLRIASGETVRVAYLGGSITEHGKWPGQTTEYLRGKFPAANFDFINAGISSYDSTSDAFRFERDVTAKGRVDVLMIDCAVNDLHNRREHTERIRAMEGICRKARRHNPHMDVIVLHFADGPHVQSYQAGKTPPIIASHEKVAAHYNISTIDMARRVADEITAKRCTWRDFGGAHPSAFGHKLYSGAIRQFIDSLCATPLPTGAKLTKRPMPAKPLDALNYENARLLKLTDATLAKGWTILPNVGVGTRPRHRNVPYLVATAPGAELTLEFTGRAIGYLGVFGPDCGITVYRIDDGPWKTHDPFTRWSPRQHLGWTHVLEAELPAGKHTLTLRTSTKKNERSKGNACRIRRFIAN